MLPDKEVQLCIDTKSDIHLTYRYFRFSRSPNAPLGILLI